MTDNKLQQANANFRTLDRSGVDTQIVLNDIAPSGAAELLGFGFPKDVPVDIAGLTTATTAYTAGDVLGTEFTFTVCRASGRGAVITSATLIDKDKLVGACDLYLFDRGSTPSADNAANSWADGDAFNGLTIVSFETPVASALNSTARAMLGLPVVVMGNSSTDIKGTLVTKTAHTYFTAATNIRIRLGVEQF